MQAVTISSVEAEYKAMSHTECEMIWIQSLLCEMRVISPGSMMMHCDNQAATYVANNPVYHERTKHI